MPHLQKSDPYPIFHPPLTMFRLLASFFLLATLAPAKPYGISIPSGDTPDLTDNIPAIRYFPSWEALQPAPGESDMQPADDLITAAEKSNSQIFGILHPPTDEDAKPIASDKETWRDFVSTLTSHCGKKITHWEVVPSYNLTDRTPDAPLHYSQLLSIARETARKSDPGALVGFSIPNGDLEFLDHSLRDGAEGQFDYISLAPFPVTSDTDPLFLSILPAIREILDEYGMDTEMPVQITLTGTPSDLEHYARLASETGYSDVFLETSPATLAEIDPDKPLKKSGAVTKAPPYKVTFGEKPSYENLYQVAPSSVFYDTELQATRMPITARPPVIRADFLAPSFPASTRNLDITIAARRIPSETSSEHPTGFGIIYESIYGIRSHELWWAVPGGDDWQIKTWTIHDAAFTGKYAWNFRIDAAGGGTDLLLKEVTLTPSAE